MHTYSQFKKSEEQVSDVADMVRTIEKIAASRLHLMTGELAALDMYTSELARALSRLSVGKHFSHPLLELHPNGNNVLVIIGGDHGLVGGLHLRLVNFYLDHTNEYQRVVAIGRQTKELLEQEHVHIERYFDGLPDDFSAQAISPAAQFLFDLYRDSAVSGVDILFATYVSLAQQKPEITQFLPFRFDRDALSNDEMLPTNSDEGLPIYEPSRERVFQRFLEMYIQIRFYHTCLEGKLSELSARTIEMEHAAKKADDMIGEYRHDYVKRRRMDATLKQLASFAVSQMI